MGKLLVSTAVFVTVGLGHIGPIQGADAQELRANIPSPSPRVLVLVDENGEAPGGLELDKVPVASKSDGRILAAKLRKRQDVVAATLDDITYRPAATPSNDTYRSQQWALDRLGAEDARLIANGAGVVVAVIDSGVNGAHPDLQGMLLPGADFLAAPYDGTGGNGLTDAFGHGTHVAGLIAATVGNTLGTAGLANGVSILSVRVMDSTGNATDATLADGLLYAINQNVDVINLSLGSTNASPVVQATIAEAVAQGIVVVAAAGNLYNDGNPTFYPAAFPDVLGVGATTSVDDRASFSNTGSYVDIAAPGHDILSTCAGTLASSRGAAYGSEYCNLSGTSMSTAYTSALAAIVQEEFPALNATDTQARLIATAQDLGTPGTDTSFGAGIIRPSAALAPPPVGSVVSDDFSQATLGSNWEFVNSSGDVALAMTGTGARLSIPAGSSHDLWSGISNAPRLVQNVANTDFGVETKFETIPSGDVALEGIYVEATPGNWIRAIAYSYGGKVWVQTSTSTGGTATGRTPTQIPASAGPVWLRLTRVGNTFTASWSSNGTAWSQFDSLSHTLTVSRIGPYAANSTAGAGAAPAFVATVDYFFNTASPIVPEDGGA